MIRDDLTQGRPAVRQTPTKTATRLGAKQALPTKNVSCQSIGLLACTCFAVGAVVFWLRAVICAYRV